MQLKFFFFLLLLQSSRLFAQSNTFEIKLSGLYQYYDVEYTESLLTSMLGGFDPRLGYEINGTYLKSILPFLSFKGSLGYSLQGRKFKEDTYNHHILQSQIGVRVRHRNIFSDLGIHGQYIVGGNDGYVNGTFPITDKFDFGATVGLGVKLTNRIKIHVDAVFMADKCTKLFINPVTATVYRRNLALGISYQF